MEGTSGFGRGPPTLTKTRRPSATSTLAATPGEKPPRRLVTDTIVLPSHCSMARCTPEGTSAQSNRTPEAGGGCDGTDVLSSYSLIISGLSDLRIPQLCGS